MVEADKNGSKLIHHMKLNEPTFAQKTVWDLIAPRLEEHAHIIFILCGIGGEGKTYLINGLIKAYTGKRIDFSEKKLDSSGANFITGVYSKKIYMPFLKRLKQLNIPVIIETNIVPSVVHQGTIIIDMSEPIRMVRNIADTDGKEAEELLMLLGVEFCPACHHPLKDGKCPEHGRQALGKVDQSGEVTS